MTVAVGVLPPGLDFSRRSELQTAPQAELNRATARVMRGRGFELSELAWNLSARLSPEDPAPAERAELAELHGRADGMLGAADRLEDCGRAWLQHECDNLHIAHVQYTCGRLALCPHCARSGSARLQRIYSKRIDQALESTPASVRLKLVTLPLRRGDNESLEDSFTRVRDAAKRLYRLLWGLPRSPAEWLQHFGLFPLTQSQWDSAGGSERRAKAARKRARESEAKQHGCVLAVEFSPESLNPHVHALVVGRYRDQRLLSAAWLMCTGDSRVTDIRAYKDGTSIAEGVKYVTKFDGRSPAELVEMFEALLVVSGGAVRSRRRVEALGILRGKLPREDEVPALICGRCGLEMHAVGIISPSLWEMGVRDVAEENRFHKRAPP